MYFLINNKINIMRFKLLSIIAIVAFVAALAFSGCNNTQPPKTTEPVEVVAEDQADSETPQEGEETEGAEKTGCCKEKKEGECAKHKEGGGCCKEKKEGECAKHKGKEGCKGKKEGECTKHKGSDGCKEKKAKCKTEGNN